MRHPLATLLGLGIAIVGLAAVLMLAIGRPVPAATELAGTWHRVPAWRAADRGPATLVVFAACPPAGDTGWPAASVFAGAGAWRDDPGPHRFLRRFSLHVMPGPGPAAAHDAVLLLLGPDRRDRAAAPAQVVAARRAVLFPG